MLPPTFQLQREQACKKYTNQRNCLFFVQHSILWQKNVIFQISLYLHHPLLHPTPSYTSHPIPLIVPRCDISLRYIWWTSRMRLWVTKKLHLQDISIWILFMPQWSFMNPFGPLLTLLYTIHESPQHPMHVSLFFLHSYQIQVYLGSDLCFQRCSCLSVKYVL